MNINTSRVNIIHFHVLFRSKEDLQMSVRNGQHQLVGLVSLGGLYKDMKLIETGNYKLFTHLILLFIFLIQNNEREA
jgi:hypothetical protein